MALDPQTKKTMEQISTGIVDVKHKITPQRLNKVLEYMGVPYHVESEKGKKKTMRVYRLVNDKKQDSIEFGSMPDLIQTTPLLEQIKKAKESAQEDKDFWSDLLGKEEGTEEKKTLPNKKRKAA